MYWNRKLKRNLILLKNQSTVHLLSDTYLLGNICLADDPTYVHYTGGTIHCDIKVTWTDIGDVLIFNDGITNILYFTLVIDKYDVSYGNSA